MKKVLIKYNNLIHLDSDYQRRVMDLGDFYQQLPFDTDFEVFHTVDLDRALLQLDPSTSWVVVVAAGHCTQDRNLYDKLIIEALKVESPLIGHILNFTDQYPHLHPQIFAFDYQRWVQAGWPAWEYSGAPERFVANGIGASAETFHDQYTPHWIESNGDAHEYTVKEMQVGSQVIREFIEMGYRIINIPEHIRKNKFHLYPDQQWQNFSDFLHGKEYTGTIYEQKTYAELVDHLDNQVQKQYYVLNTEPLQRPVVDKKIAHYIGVSAGLKLAATMIKNGFDENTCVTHFDFSIYGLQFQKFIHEQWDGDIATYEKVCNKFQSLHADSFICEPRGTYIENLEYILKQIECTAQEFKSSWQQYQSIKINLKQLNLYNKQDQVQLNNICREFDTNYLWISNAFWMEYSLVKHGKEKLKEIRDNLIKELSSTGKKIYLDVEDTWNQGIVTIGN